MRNDIIMYTSEKEMLRLNISDNLNSDLRNESNLFRKTVLEKKV